MAALVGVIAHRCWDQIIGDYGHQPAMSRQLGSMPPQTAQPGRVGRPGMMLTNAIRHPSAANADPLQAQPAQTSGPRSWVREPTGFRARGRDARRVSEEPPSAGVAGSTSARLMTTSLSEATSDWRDRDSAQVEDTTERASCAACHGVCWSWCAPRVRLPIAAWT
jgi:hypothetical protein